MLSFTHTAENAKFSAVLLLRSTFFKFPNLSFNGSFSCFADFGKTICHIWFVVQLLVFRWRKRKDLSNGSYTKDLENLDIDLPNSSYVRGHTNWSEYSFGSDGKATVLINLPTNDVSLVYEVPGNGTTHNLEIRIAFQKGSHSALGKGQWACRDQSIAAMTQVCKNLGYTVRKSYDFMVQP